MAAIWDSSLTANLHRTNTGEVKTTTSSTERIKRNIRDLEIDTSKIYDLQLKTFELLEAEYIIGEGLQVSDKVIGTEFGLIAEEVYKIYPNVVELDPDGIPAALHYNKINMMLLAEIKNLKDRIEVLENA